MYDNFVTMTVESINNETVIRVPNSVSINLVQDFIDYLSVKSILSKSEAINAAVDELAEEAQQIWWEENKARFIK